MFRHGTLVNFLPSTADSLTDRQVLVSFTAHGLILQNAVRSLSVRSTTVIMPSYANNSARKRADLRQNRLKARLLLTAEEHLRLSDRLEAHLADFFARQKTGVIAWCAPWRNEFDARRLVMRLLGLGWRAAMPVVVGKHAPMRITPWSPECPMRHDAHGIAVPQTPGECRADVLLLPLLAFDAAGYRLGYGGGYFDRTLPSLQPRPFCLGIGFELARAETVWPQPHDARLDAVATEEGIQYFGG